MDKRNYILLVMVIAMFTLTGCATLRDIAEQPAEYTEGVGETISAVNVIAGGVGLPAGVGIALGYVLHILRVIYKKKVGSKLIG